MALSYVSYTGDGSTTDFNVTFDYISKAHVKVLLDGVESTAFTWLSASQIRMTTAPANAVAVKVKRSTPNTARVVNFTNGSTLNADTDLDTDSNQLFFIAQEAYDNTVDVVAPDNSISTEKLVTASVTNAKLSDMARYSVKGRSTTGTGVPEDVDVNDLSLVSDGSTARRDLSARFGEIVNVKDHLATGDGVTDDTTAIAAAITAAAAGQILYFPKGTYVTTGLTVAKQLTIRGDGFGSILRASGNTATILTINGGAIGCLARDLQFQGTKTDETGGVQRGIYVTGSANRTRIEKCLFSGSSGLTGLNVQVHLNANQCEVTKNHFEQVKGTNPGYGYGVLVETCAKAHVTENISDQTSTQGRHHIYVSAGTNNSVVSKNTCTGGTSSLITVYALEAQEWCESNVISNNQCIDGSGTNPLTGAIDITQKCRFNTVEGNIVRGNDANGIMVQGGTSASDSLAPRNIIRGNMVAENGLNGILLVGCDEALVQGNLIYENSQASASTSVGVVVKPGSANTPTVKNKILGNVFAGTTNQRMGWRIETASGIRPSSTVIRGNDSPEGSFKYPQDDGDLTMVDETFVVKRRLSYTDFSGASTTFPLDLFALGPGEKVEAVTIKHETAFTGGAIATYTLSVGISGNFTKYAAAHNVFQAPGSTVFQDSNTAGFENMSTGETNIRALATSSGANTNAATAGVVSIWIKVRRYALAVQ